MIRNRILLKTFAVFLLIEMLSSVVAPAVSWALTAGPTAPEYTSFIPVDDSDDVNLNTGDFKYNIPLLEVPGPNGGYPLSLNYTAGIKTNQESSWVGLGFSLNSGSINRYVDGIADDCNAKISVRDQWSGGYAYNEGAGLIFNNIGLWVETNWSSQSSNKKLDFDLAFAYGGINTASMDGSNRFGLYSDFFSLSNMVSGGKPSYLNSSNQSLPNSFGQHVSFSLADSWSNRSSGVGITTYNNNTQLSTKVVAKKDYSVYRYTKTKYWLDATDNSMILGSANGEYSSSSSDSFDRYVLGEVVANPDFDNDPDLIRNNNEFLAGPSFPAYDLYDVSANGLSGSISPQVRNNPSLFDKNKLKYKNSPSGSEFDISYVKENSNIGAPQFRFLNDFSNSYKVKDVADYNLTTTGASINFGAENIGYTKIVEPYGFNADKFELAGSKQIKYFRNIEISNKDVVPCVGFVDYVRPISRIDDIEKRNQIGAYSITNEAGITYHYALPVYTSGNFSEHRKKDNTGIYNTRTVENKTPFAYTWLLTTITGSDFVDKNNNGIADEGDWGYWVNFVYGRSTDNYSFRMPSGLNDRYIEVDGTEMYSFGKKELYYLDAIYTKSHTCLFVKDRKYDGKGVSSTDGGFDRGGSAPTFKLNEMILLKNIDGSALDRINDISNNYDRTWSYGLITQGDISIAFPTQTDYLRRIAFTYDYSLCPNTLNSMENDSNNTNLYGKLTLTSVDFFGKGNISRLPGYSFNYEESDQLIGDVISLQSDIDPNELIMYAKNQSEFSNLEEGALLWFEDHNGQDFIGVVTELVPNSMTFYLKMLTGKPISADKNLVLKKTKNPPYNKNLYDYWGYYKSDIIDSDAINPINNDLLRQPTEISSKATDAWSLRAIVMPLGSKLEINYSSKSYNKIGVSNPKILNILPETGGIFDNDLSKEYVLQTHANEYNGGHLKYLKLYYNEKDMYRSLRKMFVPGTKIKITSYSKQIKWNGNVGSQINVGPLQGEVTIEEIGVNYIKISDPNHLFIDYTSPTNEVATEHEHFFSYIELPVDEIFGGGIKVTSLNIENMYGEINSEIYDFTNGTTSYEPIGFNALNTENGDESDEDLKLYRKVYFDSFKRLMYISSELPSPGVSYGNCSIHNFKNSTEASSYQSYSFNVFEDDSFIADPTDEYHYETVNVYGKSAHESRTLKLKDNTSLIGKIKSLSTLNSKNKNVLRAINYSYADDPSEYDYQGVLEEVYNEHRIIHPESAHIDDFSKDVHMATVSIRSTNPTILKEVISTDYKTGIVNKTQNLSYDFYSGDVIKSLSYDGYGNTYLSETVPAYRKYPEMGLGVNGGRNMLTQQAASYAYKVNSADVNTKLGLVSASVQTWSDQIPSLYPGLYSSSPITQSGIWRMQSSYSWKGDDVILNDDDGGLYPIANFSEFNFESGTNGTNSTQWQKNAEIALYDVNSHALEATDINGHYAATKMTPDQTRITASIANSEYDDFSYTGAEDIAQEGDLGNQFKLGTDATVVHDNSHTGINSVKTDFEGVIYENDITPNKNYTFSFWASSPDAVQVKWIVNGQSTNLKPSSIRQAGNWYQYNVSIFPKSAHIKIWCQRTVEGPTGDVYFDDLRIFPTAASMRSYVYNQWGELSHILNNENMYTRYEYDEMGRLKKSYKETFVKGEILLNETKYHYAGQ